MRKLNEVIVLIRGGGSVGSAVAQRLAHAHFRICIVENAAPTAISRGVSLSEAMFEGQYTVEDITAEKVASTLEQIYKAWRNNHLPITVDPEMSVKALLKPDVIVNAMMLKRETNSHISDAPLVIGIGSGFKAGMDVHLVVESNSGLNLGKVILEGSSEVEKPVDFAVPSSVSIVRAMDNGVFTTQKNIGDVVTANEVFAYLNDQPVGAPQAGVLRGLLRSETKVLSNDRIAAVDPIGNKSSCSYISDQQRAIAGGVLEAVMLSFNLPDEA
jgi:xanthine dehydrogenase accessory factor